MSEAPAEMGKSGNLQRATTPTSKICHWNASHNTPETVLDVADRGQVHCANYFAYNYGCHVRTTAYGLPGGQTLSLCLLWTPQLPRQLGHCHCGVKAQMDSSRCKKMTYIVAHTVPDLNVYNASGPSSINAERLVCKNIMWLVLCSEISE